MVTNLSGDIAFQQNGDQWKTHRGGHSTGLAMMIFDCSASAATSVKFIGPVPSCTWHAYYLKVKMVKKKKKSLEFTDMNKHGKQMNICTFEHFLLDLTKPPVMSVKGIIYHSRI